MTKIRKSPRRVRAALFASLIAPTACVLLHVPAASAQLAGKGAIRGTVTDSTGAAIPGARIVITNIATNVTQNLTATGAGDYEASLDPGKYTMTVSLTGFKTFVQQNIQVDGLQTFAVNAVLQNGDVTETITVTDAPPTLETANATLGITLEQEQYAALPILQDSSGQRRATDLASLLPGVSSNVSNGNSATNAGSVNGGGSRGATSAIYINGVPITSVAGEGDPRFVWTAFAVDSIEQLQVQTVGYSAIYEGQGVQNYVVKSGTNKIHGSVYDYFRNTALDTWGFAAPGVINPLRGVPTKPVEHQNEYGLFLGFPIIKDKLFVFGGYEGYRFSRQVPQQTESIPTLLQRTGDFTDQFGSTTASLFDPNTTTFTPAAGTAVARYARAPFMGLKNGIATPNVIPTGRLSPVALALERYLPAPTTNDLAANYVVNYRTGLDNWSTANRVDYHISDRHNISGVVSFGRQSTTAPSAVTVSATGGTANGLPIPYISSQQFAPKTKVLLFEDDFTFTPHIINQFKYGYGRYDGPGYNQDIGNGYGSAANGIKGLPAGQASDSFPTVTFSGNTNLARWAGFSSNRPVASGYVAVDNVQWSLGKHSVTFGGEIAWLQYNYLVNATGTNPLQLTFSNNLTANYTGTTQNTAQGSGYASYMIGAAQGATFTQAAYPETGGRFRPISPYVQDNWKVNSKLTLDIGLRYDYYPTYKEVHDRFAFLNPTATNPVTGNLGAVNFGGSGQGLTGSGFCNCRQPVNDYLKNFGPRIGFAFSPDSKTVFRGSYAIIYTHGNANGGSASSRQGSGLEGFSVSPTTTNADPTSSQTGTTFYSIDTTYPTYQLPPVFDPGIGTYYTSKISTPQQNPSYADPYYGGRAPQFQNYSFGFQRELSSTATMTMTYVGSQGRYLQPDSLIGRGYFSNALDPQYLALNTKLNDKTATAAGLADLAAIGRGLPYATFGGVGAPSVAQALKPFPQYGSVSDTYGFIGTTNYNALQVYLTKRLSRGLTFQTNYTWARAIDNNGTFRSGYDIPAAFASDGRFHKARSLDRSLSLGDQRHKFVLTGAYDLPFGKGELGGNHFITRALFGGFKISEIFQAYSGAPLSIIQNSCPTNPAIANTNACTPFENPNYSGNGKKAPTLPFTYANLSKQQLLDPNAFLTPAASPTYLFNTTPRTAAYNGLFQPPNYRLDLSLRRNFAIPTAGFHEGTHLTIEADMFNATNHTHFVYSSLNAPLTSFGTSSYGVLSVDGNTNINRAVQLAARFEF